MKKKEFMYRCRQVLASILTASMVMTSAVPASVVSASDTSAESIEAYDLSEEETQAEETIAMDEADPDQEEEITVASPDEEENEETEMLIGEQSADDGMTVDAGEDAEDTDGIADLQSRIDALPTEEEYQAMTEEEQLALYDTMQELSDIYDAMTEEEQEQVNIEKLEVLFEMVNGQVEEQEDTSSAITYVKIGENLELTAKTPYYHNGTDGALGTVDNNPENANAIFDAEKATLTLNSVNINAPVNKWYGMFYWNDDGNNKDLTIELKAETVNQISATNGGAVLGGSELRSGLVICGNGELDISGDGTLSYGTIHTRSLTVKDSAVVKVNRTGEGKAALSLADKLKIQDSANVQITGECGISNSNYKGEHKIAVSDNGTLNVESTYWAVRTKHMEFSGNAEVMIKGLSDTSLETYTQAGNVTATIENTGNGTVLDLDPTFGGKEANISGGTLNLISKNGMGFKSGTVTITGGTICSNQKLFGSSEVHMTGGKIQSGTSFSAKEFYLGDGASATNVSKWDVIQEQRNEETGLLAQNNIYPDDKSNPLIIYFGDKKKVEITLQQKEASVIYDGNSHRGFTGDVTSGEYTGALKYRYTGTDSNNEPYNSAEAPTNAGSYSVKISVPQNDSYYGSLTLNFTINKATLSVKNPEEATYSGKDSEEHSVTLDELYTKLDGAVYTVGDISDYENIIESCRVDESGMLTYRLKGNQTEDANVVIPVTIKSKNYEDVTINAVIHIAATTPSGVIKLAGTTKEWTGLQKEVSYRTFFKAAKKVTIESQNIGRDVKIQYYISSKALSEDEVKALGEKDWKEGDTLSVSEKGRYVIYAKLTDKYGNTGYLSSDGIVIYEDAQQDTEEIRYVRTSGQNQSAKVALNGNKVQSVKNGESVLEEGKDYTVAEDGTITFAGNYLQSLLASDQTYTLTVSYAPAGHEYVEGEGNEDPAATTISLNVIRAEGSITEISNISKTYDGQAVKAPTYQTTNTGVVTVEYKKASDSDDTYTTTAPSDAGEYVVRITAAADENYTVASATKNFTISKADPKVTAPIAKSDLVYNGEAQALLTDGKTTGGHLIYRLDGSEVWSEKVPSGMDAGSYTVFYKVAGDNNYNDVEPREVEINVKKKSVTVTGITAESKTYDGRTGATLNCQNAVLYGKVEKDHLSVTATGTFADHQAGKDKIVRISGLTLVNTDDAANYVLAENGQQTGTTADINPKDITVTITPNGGTYAGTITPAKAVLNDLIEGEDPEIILTYSGTANDGTEVNGIKVPELAGTYKVTASITDGNYHLSAEGSETDYTVDRASAELTVAPVVEKNYGDPAFAMTVSSRSDGTVEFGSSDEHVVTVDQNGKVTLIGAGTATITVSVAETDNYKADQKSVTITVKKTAHQLTVEKERYDGLTYGDQPFTIGTSTGDQESGIHYTSSNPAVASVDSNGKVTIKGAGTAEITIVMEESTNHVAVTKKVTITVAPKTVGIHWDNNLFVYDGKEKAPTATATGLIGADQCTVSISGGSKNEGIHTATAVSLSNPNYCLPQNGRDFAYEIKSVSDEAAASMALNAGLKVSQTGSSIGVRWGKVKGADGYNVYVQYCGSKFNSKSLNQVSKNKNSITVKKVNGKKLNLKKNYKIYVEAYKNVNGKKTVIGRSITAHIVGRKNSSYTNVKGIKLQKKNFTLKPGKSTTIKGTTVKVNRYRKQLSNAHAKELRYTTSNPAVATVTAGGKIKAVGKGSCTVYVYARNGYAQKVKVTVK